MGKLICSAPNKQELEKLINAYYYSTAWIITDDMKAYHPKMNRYSDNKITVKNGRWRFELAA